LPITDDDDIETAIHLRCCKDPVDTSTATILAGVENSANSLINDVPQSSQSSSSDSANVHQPASASPGLEPMDQDARSLAESSGHGKTVGNDRASCWREMVPSDDVGSREIVDCLACLDMELAKCSKADELLRCIWTALVNAGEVGLTKQDLKVGLRRLGISERSHLSYL
jgi:hypothetical protein